MLETTQRQVFSFGYLKTTNRMLVLASILPTISELILNAAKLQFDSSAVPFVYRTSDRGRRSARGRSIFSSPPGAAPGRFRNKRRAARCNGSSAPPASARRRCARETADAPAPARHRRPRPSRRARLAPGARPRAPDAAPGNSKSRIDNNYSGSASYSRRLGIACYQVPVSKADPGADSQLV